MSKYVRPQDAVQFFLDESTVGETGEPYLMDSTETRTFCPKCFKEFFDDDSGYVLAFGGMGVYYTCGNEDCDWFYKIMDPIEDESEVRATKEKQA